MSAKINALHCSDLLMTHDKSVHSVVDYFYGCATQHMGS